MGNFWDFNTWGSFNLLAVLLLSLLAANGLKRICRPLGNSLVPTSVLGGLLLLGVAGIYKLVTGDLFFDTPFFGGNGMDNLEIITYHTLALGFIASAYKTSENRLSKKRSTEIFNAGITTVSTYLLQAVLGMVVTMIAACIMTDFFSAAGLLLPFGYGQGTGQAMNYGNIYETQYGFEGGKSFGLTIAALGFLSASIGGTIHLYILKRRGQLPEARIEDGEMKGQAIQGKDEIPMNGSMDKLTVQFALIAGAYMLTFFLMTLLGMALPGMKPVIFGFNFLVGVLSASLISIIIRRLHKMGIVKKQHTNNFLLTRVSNFFFDIMVVAGIAAIRLGILEKYWGVILILGLSGALVTYFYNRVVAKALFPDYMEQQFVSMYGMLTGTASTGIVLLREIDGNFETPAADNMVYQTIPAIIFGFPLMLLATLAPVKPVLTLMILFLFFLVMNVLLFRSKLFGKKSAS